MYKKDELSIIDDTIQRLGKDSYLGPWLSSIRDQIERDLTNDITPTADLDYCHMVIDATQKSNTKWCAERRKDADRYAEKTIKEAVEYCNKKKAELYNILNSMQRELNR